MAKIAGDDVPAGLLPLLEKPEIRARHLAGRRIATLCHLISDKTTSLLRTTAVSGAANTFYHQAKGSFWSKVPRRGRARLPRVLAPFARLGLLPYGVHTPPNKARARKWPSNCVSRIFPRTRRRYSPQPVAAWQRCDLF